MRLLVLTVLFCGSCGAAFAHGAGHETHDVWLDWDFEWWVVLSLAIPSLLYAAGIRRMRQRLGPGRVISPLQVVSFASGMGVLVIALLSPIDPVADQLFSVHMVQHMLLLFPAPILLVYSRAPVAFMWAFRSRARGRIGKVWTGSGFNRLIRWLMNPMLVWVLFTGSFIFWHFPKPYQWALENEWIHTLEHLCFFVSALMFWTIVIEPSGRRRLGYGPTLLHVATTAVLSGLPGALLVLAKHPLYPAQTADAALWGLTPLQDQQLAGAIMWVPAGVAYVIVVAWLFAKWMEDAERQETKRVAKLSAGAMVILLSLLVLPASSRAQAASSPTIIDGNSQQGQTLIRQFGCDACHEIPGGGNASGLVGPPLDNIGSRIYIAGVLRNTPENMIRWLMHPQQVVPGNAMPDMGITEQQARDIAAYLYTLK